MTTEQPAPVGPLRVNPTAPAPADIAGGSLPHLCQRVVSQRNEVEPVSHDHRAWQRVSHGFGVRGRQVNADVGDPLTPCLGLVLDPGRNRRRRAALDVPPEPAGATSIDDAGQP